MNAPLTFRKSPRRIDGLLSYPLIQITNIADPRTTFIDSYVYVAYQYRVEVVIFSRYEAYTYCNIKRGVALQCLPNPKYDIDTNP